MHSRGCAAPQRCFPALRAALVARGRASQRHTKPQALTQTQSGAARRAKIHARPPNTGYTQGKGRARAQPLTGATGANREAVSFGSCAAAARSALRISASNSHTSPPATAREPVRGEPAAQRQRCAAAPRHSGAPRRFTLACAAARRSPRVQAAGGDCTPSWKVYKQRSMSAPARALQAQHVQVPPQGAL